MGYTGGGSVDVGRANIVNSYADSSQRAIEARPRVSSHSSAIAALLTKFHVFERICD